MRTRLETYAQTGRVNRACEAAHIEKNALQKAGSDPVNRRTFEQAEQQIGQMLEDAAVERALNGR